MAANPIAYSEIEAWARLHRITPRAWEVEAIIALDDLFLEQSSNQE